MNSKKVKKMMIKTRLRSIVIAQSITTIFFTIFIFLLLIYETNTYDNNLTIAKSTVEKCCPLGQVFSVKENFTCSYIENVKRRRQLYPLDDIVMHHENFSICRNTENLTITSLDDINESVIRAPAACLDLLYDEKLGQAIPIVFQCKNNNENVNENLNDTFINNTDVEIPVPRLSNLRICCQSFHAFDVKTRECVQTKDDISVRTYFNFLNEVLDFITVVRGRPKCKHAIIDYVVNVTTDLRVLGDGTMAALISANESLKILDNEENMCVDPGISSPDLMVVRVCMDSQYCEENACIRKCCTENRSMVGGRCKIRPTDVEQVHFHDVLLNASIERGLASSMDVLNTSDYGLLTGRPCKYGMFPVQPHEGWYITPQGHVYHPGYKLYNHDEYCMDMFYDKSMNAEGLYPFACFDGPEPGEESPIRFGVNAALELTSCAFLIMTLLVYICLPVLQNLHGKTLMCHVASMIVGYACLATVALGTPSNPGNEAKSKNFCKFLGFTLLLSWISAFSWLNVMCFDIWWTFGGLGGAAGAGGRGRAYKRFFMYSLYAWGFALFVTCMGVTADHTDFLAIYLRPNIGTESCWFERTAHLYGEVIFFIGPVAIQLIANTIFFILTAIHCSRVKAEIMRVMATPADPRSRRFRADRTKLIMNVKLFIVMGVSWLPEVISSLMNHYATGVSWRAQLFYISDTFNCLQGLLIFILFVLKKKVYHALRRRMLDVRKNAPASNGGSGLQDPYRVKNSASSSTIMSTFAVSTSP